MSLHVGPRMLLQRANVVCCASKVCVVWCVGRLEKQMGMGKATPLWQSSDGEVDAVVALLLSCIDCSSGFCVEWKVKTIDTRRLFNFL